MPRGLLAPATTHWAALQHYLWPGCALAQEGWDFDKMLGLYLARGARPLPHCVFKVEMGGAIVEFRWLQWTF